VINTRYGLPLVAQIEGSNPLLCVRVIKVVTVQPEQCAHVIQLTRRASAFRLFKLGQHNILE
jgi:hypothetical protein